MNRIIIIITVVVVALFAFFSLAGCTTYEPVTIVIEEMLPDSTMLGCVGTNVKTRFGILGDDRKFIQCGKWGEVGDTLNAHVMDAFANPPIVVLNRLEE